VTKHNLAHLDCTGGHNANASMLPQVGEGLIYHGACCWSLIISSDPPAPNSRCFDSLLGWIAGDELGRTAAPLIGFGALPSPGILCSLIWLDEIVVAAVSLPRSYLSGRRCSRRRVDTASVHPCLRA
jgi:hypothetical protein